MDKGVGYTGSASREGYGSTRGDVCIGFASGCRSSARRFTSAVKSAESSGKGGARICQGGRYPGFFSVHCRRRNGREAVAHALSQDRAQPRVRLFLRGQAEPLASAVEPAPWAPGWSGPKRGASAREPGTRRCLSQGARAAGTRGAPGLSEDTPEASRAPPGLSGVKLVDPRGRLSARGCAREAQISSADGDSSMLSPRCRA
jgi:hypothetical protein